MLDQIEHRGPDGRGMIVFHNCGPVDHDAPATLALAHCRLAIQDTSDAGAQPMSTGQEKHTLSFNGEIYNFNELRAPLETSGVQFKSGCDTEVLLHLLAAQSRAAIPHLDGQFAFCFYDSDANTLLLARDRFGIKPLYHWSPEPGVMCIASEIKAFTVHPDWKPKLNTPRALDFLARGLIDHVPGETMFAGVHQVVPGTSVLIPLDRPQDMTTDVWFDLATHAPPTNRSLVDLLAKSVEQRLIADVPVGSCLSGGIDSSAVVALASRSLHTQNAQAQLQTIHARTTDLSSSEESTIDESRFAHTAAKNAGASIDEVTPTGVALFDMLDELVWAQDEPFASPSIFAQFKVFERAQALGLKVMLDGQGADEQLCGYHAFFKAALAEYFSRGRFFAAHVHAHSAKELHGFPLTTQVAQALAAFAPKWLRARVRGSNALLSRDVAAGWNDPFDAMPNGWRSARELSLDQLTRGSLPQLLHWEDRNSMHFGVEARVPFLDHDLVAASLARPTQAKIKHGITKWALREELRTIVPGDILNRTDKVAFSTPEKAWLRSDDRAKDRLERGLTAAADLLSPTAAHRLRAMLSEGDDAPTYDNVVWRVICFGAWVERFGIDMERAVPFCPERGIAM